MQHYCTLFNTAYLSRAMVMYDSLVETKAEFHLYIFAFDDTVTDFFRTTYARNNITVISLAEFENEELLRIKPSRSAGEYCWTCTPSVILYCLEKYNIPSCTYIDADLYFYADPGVLLAEMGNRSVLITEHRFTKEYEKGAANGIYCVQFMTFKSDSNGLTALKWWRDECIKWCYARSEDGKFGDQKYLDDWLVRFEGVHSLQHLGGGVAPWNVQQYTFEKTPGGDTFGIETKTGEKFQVVFFHFHSLKFYTNNTIWLSNYPTSSSAFNYLYRPYVKALLAKENELKKSLPGKDTAGKIVNPVSFYRYGWTLFLYLYWQDVKTAVKYLIGRKLRSRYESHNLYSTTDFKK